MKHHYFPALDGLRCIAIVIVMIAHADAPFLRSGGIGVDVFFVLSGFLISSILLAEHSKYGSINFFNFYVRRFLRLLPALCLAVAFVFIEQRVVYGHWQLKKLAIVMTYLMNWAKVVTEGKHFPMGHTWSLAIEEQFYLVWPIVLTLVCSLITSRRARCATFFGLVLLIAMYRAAMVGSYSAVRIYYGSDTHSDGLVMGAAIAFLVAALPARRLTAAQSRWLGRLIAPVAAIVLAGLIARLHWWDAAMGRYGYLLVALTAGTIVLDLVAGSHGLARVILSHGAMIWVGKISYGLYLWHLPVYHAMDDFNLPDKWWLKLLIGAPITVALAAASYYTVERYFLKLKDRFVRTAKPAVQPDTSEDAVAESVALS